MVQFIGNGKQQRPFIRGKHGKLMRLAHLERDVPRVTGPDFDAAPSPLADELSQPAPCGYLPAGGWPHRYARDGHRDVCYKCADVEANEQLAKPVCPACHGTGCANGRIPTDGLDEPIACPDCNGTGQQKEER